LFVHNTYYWFGEQRGVYISKGINVYASKDLQNWKVEGLALAKSNDLQSEIAVGGSMERLKIVYDARTNKYVMWFHLELPRMLPCVW